jgi:hypothetical protein
MSLVFWVPLAAWLEPLVFWLACSAEADRMKPVAKAVAVSKTLRIEVSLVRWAGLLCFRDHRAVGGRAR